ncbi:hypothetical protein BDZ89DRAFT_1077489 [Hymenopellis radicata]|nr:hypothetical protein BDZ89DRAFT_1077489 [Hymenopellis radicata]
MATETTLFSSFLMLPSELSDEIFGELEKADLQRLRLVCRALSKSRTIQEKLFSTLYIHLYKYKPQTPNVLPLASFCAAVNSGRTDIASFVRRLDIQGEHWHWLPSDGIVALAKRNLKALFSAQRRLVKALIEILPHLNGVTKLNLSFVSQPNMVNKPLMDSLTSMPSISEVTMFDSGGVFRPKNEPHFPLGFRDLERFTIHGILNETDFTSLLQHSCRTLTHLTCAGIGELQLANVSQRWRGVPLRFISTNYDFPATVWKAFSKTGICLEHVTVRHPIQRAGLLAYLDSYSGLHSLSIRMASAESFPSEALHNFFTNTLVKHKESITSVDIYPMNRTSWSCDAEALLALNQCTRLSILRVNMDPQQSPNPIAVFLDLLPSWCNLSEVEFYTPDEAMDVGILAVVVDRVLAFRSFQDTYAMKMFHFRCSIWKITPEVFEDDSYGFSATVCQNGHPHDGEPYRGAAQHRNWWWASDFAHPR